MRLLKEVDAADKVIENLACCRGFRWRLLKQGGAYGAKATLWGAADAAVGTPAEQGEEVRLRIEDAIAIYRPSR